MSSPDVQPRSVNFANALNYIANDPLAEPDLPRQAKDVVERIDQARETPAEVLASPVEAAETNLGSTTLKLMKDGIEAWGKAETQIALDFDARGVSLLFACASSPAIAVDRALLFGELATRSGPIGYALDDEQRQAIFSMIDDLTLSREELFLQCIQDNWSQALVDASWDASLEFLQSRITGATANCAANLRGVPLPTHRKISNEWTAFRTGLAGRSPSAYEVWTFARNLDRKYGTYYR